MKACFKCKTVRPLSEYYKHSMMGDGHLNKCKECTKNDARKHRAENIDAVREYDRNRAMLPRRVEVRAAYQKTEDGRQAHAMALARSKARFPEKYAARTALRSAIRNGKIIKPTACSCCGVECITHGHHEDYSKPLNVVWLCVPCHAARHRELKQQRAA